MEEELEAGVRELFKPTGTTRTIYPLFQGMINPLISGSKESVGNVMDCLVRGGQEDGVHHKYDEKFMTVPAQLLVRERRDGAKEVRFITKNGFDLQFIKIAGTTNTVFMYVNEFTKD